MINDEAVRGKEDPSVVTVDFDHHDPALAANPYATYEALRSQCPVVWTTAHNGFWVLTDYATVHGAARDPETYKSSHGTLIPEMLMPVFPPDTDPPQTQQLRRMILDKLTPQAVAAIEPHAYGVAESLVDSFIEAGECDIMEDFAKPLPVRVVMPLLGIPEEGWREFSEKVTDVSHKLTSDPEACLAGLVSVCADFTTVIDERRANGLRDDLISALLAGQLDGEPLSDQQLYAYLLTLVGGGIFTTTAALGNAMIRMHREPKLRDQLLDRPELVPNAVDEFLRLDAPVQMVSRTLSRDIELNGCPMKAGDRTMLVWAAANHDPDVFDEPDEVNFERRTNAHLTFGIGVHRCIGAHLGHSMFRIMLETVLARMPDFELLGDPEEHRYEDPGMVYGLHHLAVRFTPGSRRSG